jgi:hypothetical protein
MAGVLRRLRSELEYQRYAWNVFYRWYVLRDYKK